jgi:hypothetical protein
MILIKNMEGSLNWNMKKQKNLYILKEFKPNRSLVFRKKEILEKLKGQ